MKAGEPKRARPVRGEQHLLPRAREERRLALGVVDPALEGPRKAEQAQGA